ncbi:hypothetical protein SAMN05421770_103486 [Granulicella rosea]|uniref:Uncharacterized protein n=1 Tax=Granulicella rosea TaxID=474952 RepID=A0A239J834_9BACT|nr:hypothetical protein [Granulicella rosea]SNT02051.1 hypothetical protein SAMN05421770_103486 [Granulicella rosea]
MLLELRAENYAVMDRASAAFGTGLNLLTGEMGAGKSTCMSQLRVRCIVRGILLITLLLAEQSASAGGIIISPDHLAEPATQSLESPALPRLLDRSDPRWTTGRSLQRARLGKRMTDRILRDLWALDDAASAEENTMVLPFAVVQPGRKRHLIRVWAGGDACGATGVCSMLIYDVDSGKKLLATAGWDFQFLRAAHHGAHDILVRDKSSCCEGSRILYRYDGTRYLRIWQVAEQY